MSPQIECIPHEFSHLVVKIWRKNRKCDQKSPRKLRQTHSAGKATEQYFSLAVKKTKTKFESFAKHQTYADYDHEQQIITCRSRLWITHCEITVATAAPPTPNLKENMRMGQRMIFTTLPRTAKRTQMSVDTCRKHCTMYFSLCLTIDNSIYISK